MVKDKKTLLLIDSFALIFRAYYAFPASLRSPNGEPTNAVYGFTSILLDVITKFKPHNVIAVFDSAGPTFRKTEHSFYKANREEADDLLKAQIPMVRSLLESFSIPVLSVEGYEADDIIATIDKRHSGEWAQTIIVTGDQDIFQLVDNDTSVYLSGKRFADSKLYGEQEIKEKLGIYPSQVIDFKALKGDPSDNIPGVKGIGGKTAVELLEKYGSFDQIYSNIDAVSGSLKDKLVNGYQMGITSKKLATIQSEVPISFDFSLSIFGGQAITESLAKVRSFGFKSLENKLLTLFKEYKVQINSNTSDSQLTFDVLPKSTDANKLSNEEFLKYLGKATDVYLLSEISNQEKSPIHYSLQSLTLFIEKGFVWTEFRVSFEQALEAIEGKNVKILEVKPFLHAIINTGLHFKPNSILDLTIGAFVESGGVTKKALDTLLAHYSIPKLAPAVASLPVLEKIITQGIEKKEQNGILEIERRCLSTIVKMEQTGITFDNAQIEEIKRTLESKKEELKESIYKTAGLEFNINSPSQVADILFNKMQLNSFLKTKKGSFSTSELVLKKITDNPIGSLILEYREIEKLLSTYVRAIPEYVDKDKKIRSVFDQIGAVSGRFSSKNPNLQNIPKDPVQDVNFRNLFVAQKNKVLVSFDYSQQELRILAAMAKEEELVQAFSKDEDAHTLTASKLFGVDLLGVTPEQRKIGKTVNFSVIYGISSFGLSERLGIPKAEAAIFISKFFTKYSGIKTFMDNMLEIASQNGYSKTILGRRRYNPEINSKNQKLKLAAQRELFNFAIQGTAADIMKEVIANFENIKEKFDADLLLQIHDEFLFEVLYKPDSDEFAEFVSEIKKIMLNPLDIGVKYKVEVSVGERWGELTKINL